jgi:hypothetical protein
VGSKTTGARSGIRGHAPPERASRVRRWLAPLLIGGVAAVLLFWNLTDTYLWQDEANTAVLAVRLLEHGKPLAYDGRNLISDDNYAAMDVKTFIERTHDGRKAFEDCVRRGVLKPDGMWTFHPWGQFLVAGLSIALLGPTTLAARFPFALAALATVLALYWLARRVFRSTLIASLAASLLTLNVYWLLHSRQARYYALTSLFLILTLMVYLRWQKGARFGAAIFVAVAWCWFQVDYGTVWPVFGILFLDATVHALRTDWRSVSKPITAGLALLAGIAPFIFFYQLAHRQSGLLGTWLHRLRVAVFNLNEFVAPAIVVLAALVWVALRGRRLPPLEARLVAISGAIIVALALWVPTVAPMTFVRYVIMAAPVGALLTAWLSVRLLGAHAPRLAWLAVAVVALTPWLCMPMDGLVAGPKWERTGTILRSELGLIGSDIFAHRVDPNRLVIEWLEKNAVPTDEILVNYEDLPLMYYLPNRIRGGIAAYRAEDDASVPPRYVILRRTVPFVYWPAFKREVDRYYWTQVAVKAPDIRWGNNPDPEGHIQDRTQADDLLFFERVDQPPVAR